MNNLLNEIRTVLAKRIEIKNIQFNIENDQIPKKNKALSLDCSIMFVDMRNSTMLTDINSKNNMVRIYKALARIVIHNVSKYGGDVKQIVGDGFLCLFTKDKNKSAQKALECALSINTDIVEILNPEINCFSQPIQVGIGICTGNVLISKVGRKGKGKVAVPVFAGCTTNYASKYCGLAIGEEVIICEKTFNELSKDDKNYFEKKSKTINGNQHIVYCICP